MPIVSRRQIAELTGLPPSTLSRHLARFPAARAGRGHYDTTDRGLAAWLALQQAEQVNTAPGEHTVKPLRPQPGPSGPYILPSGVAIDPRAWVALRGPDEGLAIRVLEHLIDGWRLTPHSAVPDLLGFEPMELPSGRIVNRAQWTRLRQANDAQAEHAFDVLIRSFGTEATA